MDKDFEDSHYPVVSAQICSLHLSCREVGTISTDMAKFEYACPIHFVCKSRPTATSLPNSDHIRPPTQRHTANLVIMPVEDCVVESNSVRAARWLLAAQDRHRARVARVSRSSRLRNATTLKEPSIRDAAKRFKCGKSQLAKHLKALRETGSPDLSLRWVGRPRALRDDEDAALEAYASWLVQSGYVSLATRDLMEDAANRLRARRIPPEGPVSRAWWPRWRRDHPWFRTTAYRPVETARLSVEESIAIFDQFYDKLEDAVETYRITASACWNADEMGCRIAMLSGKVKILAIRMEKNKQVCQWLTCVLFVPGKMLTIVFS